MGPRLRTPQNHRLSKPNYWSSSMANGWTLERRERQSVLIRTWRPWERSTGPTSEEGKARSSRNGDKGGEWRAFRDLKRQVNSMLREQEQWRRAVW